MWWLDHGAHGWTHLYRFPRAPYDTARKKKDENGKSVYMTREEYLIERAASDKKFEKSQAVAKFISPYSESFPFSAETRAFPKNPKEHAEIKKKRTASRQRARLGASYTYVPLAEISNRWEVYAKPLGKLIADGPQTNLHWMYLYLAAYLCRLGMSPDLIPAFIGMVCNHAGSGNTPVNVAGAALTVKKWLNREACAGGRHLNQHFPHIYQAVTKTFTLAQTHAQMFDIDFGL